MWATPIDNIGNTRKLYPQLAPKLVRPEPAEYSKATDVYAMGNLLETLLQEDWDGFNSRTRFLCRGWNNEFHGPKLDVMIKSMMDKDPRKRRDCGHWAAEMVRAFKDCQLVPLNSRYLRDQLLL